MTGISRRHFVAGAGAAIGGTLLRPTTAGATPLGLPIGLQLYTVSAEIARDVEATLRTVAAIGYRDVETGLAPGGWDSQRFSRLLKSLGIGWHSCHVLLPDLQARADAIFAQCREAGIERAIVTTPFVQDLSRLKPLPLDDPRVKQYGAGIAPFIAMLSTLTLDDWKWNAEQLNKYGELAKRTGVTLGYHNHNFEFGKFGEVLAYDELLRLTDPALVTMELDCGWMASAGHDPVDYLTNHPGRYSLLHIKDLKAGSGTGAEVRTTEVGRGTIDWKRIFAAAGKAGIKGYYVEQEPPNERPQLESAKISYDYLKALEG